MTRPVLAWRAPDHYDLGERPPGFSINAPGDDPLAACLISAGGGSSLFDLDPPELGAKLLLEWFWFHWQRYASNEAAAIRRRRFMRLVQPPAKADPEISASLAEELP